jgi:hypothetical protein
MSLIIHYLEKLGGDQDLKKTVASVETLRYLCPQ